MKVIVHGANGQMGKLVYGCVTAGNHGAELAAAVESLNTPDGMYPSLDAFEGEADCIIDFSHHTLTKTVVDYAVKRGLALVEATTGQTEEEEAILEEAAKSIPVFFAHNMAIAATLVGELCKMAAKSYPDADIEIVEVHHNRKVDVPSGTALIIANAIKEVKTDAVFNIGRPDNGKRTKEEIGIHSLRLGNVVGTHEIIFDNGSQSLTIRHEAKDRSMFADGACAAAAFVTGKEPGLYAMKDMIKD